MFQQGLGTFASGNQSQTEASCSVDFTPLFPHWLGFVFSPILEMDRSFIAEVAQS